MAASELPRTAVLAPLKLWAIAALFFAALCGLPIVEAARAEGGQNRTGRSCERGGSGSGCAEPVADASPAAEPAADSDGLKHAASDCLEDAKPGSHKFRYWLSSYAAAYIRHSDSFVLKHTSDCSGLAMDASVTVVPFIDRHAPLNASWAFIDIPPDVVLSTTYLCFVAQRVGRPQCLAKLEPTRVPPRFHHFLKLWYRSGRTKAMVDELDILDSGTARSAIDWVAFLLALSAVLFVISLIYGVVMVMHLPHNKVQKYEIVEALAPWKTWLHDSVNMLALVSAVSGFLGVLSDYMLKDARPNVILTIYSWPPTFGIIAMARLGLSTCKTQLFNAALGQGRVIVAEPEISTLDILASVGILLFLLCMASATFSCSSNGEWRMELFLPVVSLLKIGVSLFVKERDQRQQLCRIPLGPLATSMKDESAGKPDKFVRHMQSAQVEIPERAFCASCRQGEDPLELIQAGPLEECGRRYSIPDILWHGKYLHKATGSKLGFFVLPTIFFNCTLLLSLSLRSTAYFFARPQMETMASSEIVMDPPFDIDKRDFSFYFDAVQDQLALFTTSDRAVTRHMNFTLNSRPITLSNKSAVLVDMYLPKLFPWDFEFQLKGLGHGLNSNFRAQLVPVVKVFSSVVIQVGDSWSRCWPWALARNSKLSIPRDTEMFDLELSVRMWAPTVPLSRAEAERRYSAANSRIPGEYEVLTVFEKPNLTGAEQLRYERRSEGYVCKELCKLDLRCLGSFEGEDGCFFGMGPDTTQTQMDSCLSTHSNKALVGDAAHCGFYRFMERQGRHKVHLCVGRDEEEGAKCYSTIMDRETGIIVIRGITVPPNVVDRTFTATVRLIEEEFRSATQGGFTQMDKYEAMTVTFSLGAPLPSRLAVAAALTSGIKLNTSSPMEDGEKVIAEIKPFDSFDFTDPQDPWIDLVVAARDPVDSSWTMNWTGSSEVIVKPREGPLTGRLMCDFEDFAPLTVCGGLQASQAVTVKIPKWFPGGKSVSLTVGPSAAALTDSAVQPRTMTVYFTTRGDEEPAQWAIRKHCAVDLTGLTIQGRSRALSSRVFEEAAMMCTQVSLSKAQPRLARFLNDTDAFLLRQVATKPRGKRIRSRSATVSFGPGSRFANSVAALTFVGGVLLVELLRFVELGLRKYPDDVHVVRLLEHVLLNQQGVGYETMSELAVQLRGDSLVIPANFDNVQDLSGVAMDLESRTHHREEIVISWDRLAQLTRRRAALIERACKLTPDSSSDLSTALKRAIEEDKGDDDSDGWKQLVQALRSCANEKPELTFAGDTESTSALSSVLKINEERLRTYKFRKLKEFPQSDTWLTSDLTCAGYNVAGEPTFTVVRRWTDLLLLSRHMELIKSVGSSTDRSHRGVDATYDRLGLDSTAGMHRDTAMKLARDVELRTTQSIVALKPGDIGVNTRSAALRAAMAPQGKYSLFGEVRLGHLGITTDTLKSLVPVLAEIRRAIEVLDLSGNPIEHKGISLLRQFFSSSYGSLEHGLLAVNLSDTSTSTCTDSIDELELEDDEVSTTEPSEIDAADEFVIPDKDIPSKFTFLRAMSRLNSLDLSHAALCPKDVEQIGVLLGGLCNLKSLDISRNGFGMRGLRHLARASSPYLQSLNLADNRIEFRESNGRQTLGTILSSHTGLRALDISGNSADDEVMMSQVLPALEALNISSLRLRGLAIGASGHDVYARYFGKLLARRSAALDLSWTAFGAAAPAVLLQAASGLKKGHYWSLLDLSGLELNQDSIAALDALLQVVQIGTLRLDSVGLTDLLLGQLVLGKEKGDILQKLTHLSIANNRLGSAYKTLDASRTIRAEVDPVRHLLKLAEGVQIVDLSGNAFDGDASTFMGRGIGQLYKLKELNLVGCTISGTIFASMRVRAEVFGMKMPVEHLDLSMNMLGSSLVAEALPWLGLLEGSLVKLIIHGNNVSGPDVATLLKGLAKLPKLRFLSLFGPRGTPGTAIERDDPEVLAFRQRAPGVMVV